MTTIRVITLRLDARDAEECAILQAYDAAINYKKQNVLRMLLKAGLRTYGNFTYNPFAGVQHTLSTEKEIKSKSVKVSSEHSPDIQYTAPEITSDNQTPATDLNKMKREGLNGIFGDQSL